MAKRIEWIDTAKGFCIILVVLYHLFIVCSPYNTLFQSPIGYALMSFRMPLYFLLSGLFFKEYDGLFNFAKKKTNKLIIPFLFFWLLTFFYKRHSIMSATSGEELANQIFSLSPLNPIWFLWCLFVLNIIYATCRKYLPLKISWVVSIVLGVIGFMLGEANIKIPNYVDTALTAMPFFVIGNILNYYNALRVELSKNNCLVICVVLLISVYIINGINGGECSFYYNQYDASIIQLYYGGLAGSIAILLLSKCLGQLPIISYIGRYSIVILCTHKMILNEFRKYYDVISQPFGDYTNFVLLIIMIIMYIPIIMFSIKYLPYVFAQKDLIK